MKTYTDETKAAVMAALLEGQSVSRVAQEYKIPEGTVRGWKSKAKELVDVPRQKKEAVGDLLMELLTENLKSLVAISKAASDAEWLHKQSAAEVGTLFGIKHDKAVRLIEALNSNAEGN